MDGVPHPFVLNLPKLAEESLARLARHFDPERVALTGGVAVEYHLACAGRAAIRDRIGDLDFVAQTPEEIAPRVTRDFLVSHYHLPGASAAKGMLQLVDPLAALRVDVFSDTTNAIASAKFANCGDLRLLVLGPAAILENKLRTIARASAADPVDPKHVRDAHALAGLCGRAVPASTPYCAPTRYCTDLNARCERCEASRTAEFPLAPKQEIFALLGYV
jgi:hypothetical protein